MELSIEVNHAYGASIFICRGKLIQGQESDYLFDLVTRPDNRDVVLDVEQLDGFDRDGLCTIVLCHELLSQTNRRLLLRNASSEMLLDLDLARLKPDKGPRSDGTAETFEFAPATSKRLNSQ